MRLASFLATLLLLIAQVFAQEQEIDKLVTDLMAKKGVPGLSIAVVKDGALILAKGYGLADVENGVMATADHSYQIGSVTKQFTAALTMMLVEQGKVKLDEPMKSYLPDVPKAWDPVTVRHLLTHTSGIKSYTSIEGFFDRARDKTSHATLIGYVKDLPFDYQPGERWSYNNTGYYLLGMLVEKVSGKTYREALQDMICKPLGMTETDVNDWRRTIKNRARGYDPNPKTGPTNAAWIDMGWPYAAGAIVSTVKDMAKWDAALASGKLLKQSSLDQMWSPVKLKDGKTFGYGFGWMLLSINRVPVIEHGGDIPGFNANIMRIPSKKLTIIAMCNAGPGISTQVCRSVAGLLEPALLVAEEKPIADATPEVTKHLRSVVEELIAGTMKKEYFTAEMQKTIFPDLAQQAHRMLSTSGAFKRFELLETKEEAGTKHRRYLMIVGDLELVAQFVIAADGKIALFGLRPR